MPTHRLSPTCRIVLLGSSCGRKPAVQRLFSLSRAVAEHLGNVSRRFWYTSNAYPFRSSYNDHDYDIGQRQLFFLLQLDFPIVNCVYISAKH